MDEREQSARTRAISKTFHAFLGEMCCAWPSAQAGTPLTNTAPTDDAYAYHPIEPGVFLDLLTVALDHVPDAECPLFVDAGCGPGVTLKLACMLAQGLGRWLRVEGLELQPRLAEFARDFSGCLVHEADLRTWNYSTYDIVYGFKPLRDPHHAEWQTRLADTTRPGTVLISGFFPWKGSRERVRTVYRQGGSEILIRV